VCVSRERLSGIDRSIDRWIDRGGSGIDRSELVRSGIDRSGRIRNRSI
jgi:hypothetical protein